MRTLSLLTVAFTRPGLKIASATALLVMTSALPANAERRMDEWFECWPVEVAVLASRTQVECQFSLLPTTGDLLSTILGAPFANIRFFVVPASDARLTSSTVTVAQAAITSNRSIWIAFDRLDITGQSYGCGIADCRPLHGLKLDLVRQEEHAKLQINVSSGDVNDPTSVFSATVLLEGSRVPANIVGGAVTTFKSEQLPIDDGKLVSGKVAGTYDLEFFVAEEIRCAARVHLLILGDGTVDVRGHADDWCTPGKFIVEGVGDAGVARLLRP